MALIRRGIAFLNIDTVKPLADLRKKQLEINDELVERVIAILHKWMGRRAKLAHNGLF